MVGKASIPIVTTVAPTIPVDAANNIPTNITPTPKPPLIEPNKSAIDSNNLDAILVFSNKTPIKIKSGTATKASFIIIP